MSGGFSGWLVFLHLPRGFGQSVGEGLCWCAAVHVAALVGPALIVTCEEVIENGLHLLDRLEPCAASLDADRPPRKGRRNSAKAVLLSPIPALLSPSVRPMRH